MITYNPHEKEQMIQKFFYSKDPLKLIRFPKKQKDKYMCLLWVCDLFEQGKTYTETEVNQILKPVFQDYVLLRRYLVDFALLLRMKDGSSYWLADQDLKTQEEDPS